MAKAKEKPALPLMLKQSGLRQVRMLSLVRRVMNTLVISAFPSTGKSYFCRHTNKKVLDSDSSHFSWIEKGIRNPDFPQNYINHIKENIGHVDIILVSSHKVVRDALVINNINFLLVYPTKDQKEDYLLRCNIRGSDKQFIEMLNNKWDSFLDELRNQKSCIHIPLFQGEYLSDRIK